ncbi:hypothetical protein ANTRET_LOCUS1707, partial [Anthophora retusa]
MQNSVVKKHRSKRKTYWCAPRKVKSIHTAEDADNSQMKDVKTKKKPRKKKRKLIKRVRRIDILAQPKFINDKPVPKNQYTNVNFIPFVSRSYNASRNTVIGSTPKHKIAKTPVTTNRTNCTSPRKILNIKKLKKKHKLPSPFTSKDSSPIVLPKKIGVRLISLVKKRIKELTNSKNIK